MSEQPTLREILEEAGQDFEEFVENAQDIGARLMLDQMERAVTDGGKFSDERANRFVSAEVENAALRAQVEELTRERDELLEGFKFEQESALALEAQAEKEHERAEQAEAKLARVEDAILWLMGEHPTEWFAPPPSDAPRYWWRSEFRRRLAAARKSEEGR